MSYQIQLLSDEDFEALPYPETKLSLGIADPVKNTAYVRYTQSGDLNKYLINHELEHLIEGRGGEHSDHYRHGVYYKGFGNVFNAVGSGLSNIGGGLVRGATQLGTGIGRSIGGAASSIGSGISNLAGSLSKATNWGGGFQGGANPSGGLAAAAASNRALRAPMNYSAGGSAALGASPPMVGGINPFRIPVNSPLNQFKTSGGFGGHGASGTWGQQPTAMVSPTVKPMSMTTPSTPITAQVGQGIQTTQAPQGDDFFGQMKNQIGQGVGQGIAGLATNKIMSMFSGATGVTQLPRMPDVSQLPSVQALKNFDFRGNMSQLDPALQSAINRDFDRIDAQEQHDFRNRWKNVRPGADIENDSVFARDYQNLQQAQAMRRADAMAKYRFEMISTNLGINKLEYDRLENLAQLDVDQISYNTGMSAVEAMNLKNMFGVGTSIAGTTQTNSLGSGIVGSFLPKSPSVTGGV